MYWVKNDFIKKPQKSIVEPNSVVQMRNQVLDDVYPQNQGLINQNASNQMNLKKLKQILKN